MVWAARTRETICEEDLVNNFELLKAVLLEIGHVQPTYTLLDFKAAFIVATSQHNFHSNLYQKKGGRGLIKDTLQHVKISRKHDIYIKYG